MKEVIDVKELIGWEGLYAVSEHGYVLSLRTMKPLAGDVNSTGYKRVTCYDKSTGRKERHFVHRLVAQYFIPNPLGYPEVNHIDSNKQNNSVENLEWCDRIYNQHECIKHVKPSKYKPFEVHWSNGDIERFDYAPELAQRLHTTRRTVHNWLDHIHRGYQRYGIQEIARIQ